MSAQHIYTGRLKTPFHPRIAELDSLNTWHNWAGYSSAEALYCEDMEYFAIRNSTGVFDITPMTKYLITGPDALDFLDRLKEKLVEFKNRLNNEVEKISTNELINFINNKLKNK